MATEAAEIGEDMTHAKRRMATIVVVFAVLIAPVAAAGATSLWADIPDDSIFVNDTNWMKVTGVSLGCNPPANTEYCPKDLLTREQMAAFMHRLSDAQVVDAATAIDAENAENSDTVDGRDADELMSITGSDSGDTSFVPGPPPSGNSKLLATLTGFDVPASGGVITAHGNVQAEPVSGTQLGLVWVDIDGGGDCDSPIPDGAAGTGSYLTEIVILETTSAITTRAVAAGTHRIDLCVAGFATPTTAETRIISHLNATWTPIASAAGVDAASGPARTWQEILAPYVGALDG